MNKEIKENTNKKLLIALIISSIISYLLIAYYRYAIIKYNNKYFTISADFLINLFDDIIFRIEAMLAFVPVILGLLPFLLILPVIYFYAFYKVYFSSKPIIIKYKLLLFSIFLISLFWSIFFVGDLWVSF